MAAMMAAVQPQEAMGKKILTMTLRLTADSIPTDATIQVTDVLFQAGDTVTGWVPHVTEMPWTAGIVGN